MAHGNQPLPAKGLKEKDQVRTSSLLTKMTFLRGYLARGMALPYPSVHCPPPDYHLLFPTYLSSGFVRTAA